MKTSLGFKVLALSSLILATAVRAADKALVFTQELKKEELFEKLSFPALISAAAGGSFYSPIEAIVSEIKKPLGSRIKKGEVLVVLQNTDPIYNYAPIKVKAPISGVLSDLKISKGLQVQKGAELGSLIEPSELLVKVEIPAEDLKKISLGQFATLESSSVENTQIQTVELKLKSLSPLIDNLTGTAKGEFLVTGGAEFLRPGLVGRVNLKSDKREALLISQNSIIFKDGKKFLRVVQNGKAVFRAVELGKSLEDKTEIISGVSVGEIAIVRASRFLKDGEAVEVFKPQANDSKAQAR